MLQVAFGQSKYYSDNLVENINRSIRQKIRRGEWLTLAPFGYVNNPKTRNIEPDSVKSKVLVRMFEEFAKGDHTFKSMSEFLSDLGITSRNGTPLAKSAVQAILTNRAYLGLVNHKGEYYDGSFQPILSPKMFEAVQKVLERNAKPRKSKTKHNFPFTGLFSCGECESGITAQWATGRLGGKYRYYRCTKKKGNCKQGYLREDLLIAQLRERLQTFAFCDECVGKMLEQVSIWEKEADNSSQSFVQNLKNKQKENQGRLDKLVSLYLDDDIEKNAYLDRREKLMREKVTLNTDMKDFKRNGKNWVEPLRSWILPSR